MSSKLNFIPDINSYEDIRKEMNDDLNYRLTNRHKKTSLGRPLYYRINVQIIITQECPFECPFCIERKNPMTGYNNFKGQITSLKEVLKENPSARLTITGGEPALYPNHIREIVDTYKNYSDNVFCSINTSGYSTEINGLAHINLSNNEYVHQNPELFPNCTLQTIVANPTLKYIKKYMNDNKANSFSFRFMSDLEKKDYPILIWNELKNDKEIIINTFRIGDFFVYTTFNYNGKHARITLGDMWQQKNNDYKDGYSNIIIHPDGKIGINWN